jgi:hypothetical protein
LPEKKQRKIRLLKARDWRMARSVVCWFSVKSRQSLAFSDSMDLSYFKAEPIVCGPDLTPETSALPKQSPKG